MDKRIVELLQRAPSFKLVVDELFQDYLKLLDRVQELEKVSGSTLQLRNAVRVAMQKERTELAEAREGLQRARAEVEELKAKLDLEKKEVAKAKHAAEKAMAETSALRTELDSVKQRAEKAETKTGELAKHGLKFLLEQNEKKRKADNLDSNNNNNNNNGETNQPNKKPMIMSMYI